MKCEKLFQIYNCSINIFNKGQDIALLIIRLWIAYIFFKSGLTKISNLEQTLFLFEYEYAVPLLPVPLAAFLATAAELICPIFLITGAFTRIAALPLFLMTVIIELLIIQNQLHHYWLLMIFLTLSFGAGKISADNFVIAKKFKLKV